MNISDCVLTDRLGDNYKKSDNEDEKALDDEFRSIKAAEAIEVADVINAIQSAKPPLDPPPNYMFDMFATLYRQFRRR
jgi:hypothetical protein